MRRRLSRLLPSSAVQRARLISRACSKLVRSFISLPSLAHGRDLRLEILAEPRRGELPQNSATALTLRPQRRAFRVLLLNHSAVVATNDKSFCRHRPATPFDGGVMHLSRSLVAATATVLLAAIMPQLVQAREIVGFSGAYSSGTVVVKTNERALYYVLGNGQAVRYPVGVGRVGK